MMEEIAQPTRRLIRNAAKCLQCGDVVESRHRWDCNLCTCGALMVDGGTDYIKRGWIDDDTHGIEEMCEWEEVSDSEE